VAGRRLRLCLAVALLVAICGGPDLARRKSREVNPAAFPAWVKEAIDRAPESSEYDVVWLHEEQIVRPEPAGGVTVTRRLAGKVFKPSGLDALGTWPLYFVKGDDIHKLEAWTLRPDGTGRRADPKEDVTEAPAVGGELVFTDQRVRVIKAQGVAVGAIVAFEDVKVEQLDVGMEEFTFGDAERPTLYSRFELQAPPDWIWKIVPLQSDTLEVERAVAGEAYVARNQEPLPREPGRPSSIRILPKVSAHWRSPGGERGFEDWNAVARWALEMAEAVLDEPGEAAQLAERFKPGTPEELLPALERAFEFAARDVRYVSIDIGLGIGAGYRPSTPASVCEKRYGDCKDKAFLMRALARPWGLETYPVHVRTRSRGPLEESTPSPGQFNHCIAAVKLPEGVGEDLWTTLEVEGIGRVVFLDATSRESSPWCLPWGDQGTTALLVHPGGGKLVTLPVQPPEAGATARELDAEVDAQGNLLQASLVETWTGSSASRVRDYYSGLSDMQHRAKVLENLQDRFPATSVTDYRIEGLDEVCLPVVETTTLEGGRLGKKVGDLLILEPGQAGYGLLAGTPPKPPRRWPFVLGRPRREELRVTLRLPEGWALEELPDGEEVESPYLAARASWSIEDGRVLYRREMDILAEEVPPEDYPVFREDLLRVRTADRQAVVLVRP
jgi:hypothetical protein